MGDNGKRYRATRRPHRALRFIAGAVMVVGIAIAAFPYLEAWWRRLGMDCKVDQYAAAVEELREDGGSLQDLLDAVDAYNQELDATGQAGLRDAWSYMEPSFDLAQWGLADEMFGRLRIPAAGVDMPLYLGATQEHIDAGAAHLTQTSLPVRAVEGVSANAVIAGHRGYRANTYFNNIPKLVEGDEVYVDNPWGTLVYRVTNTAIIDPSDIDAVKIQPGKTMLTLVTCHPLYENYQRYVVYCEQM